MPETRIITIERKPDGRLAPTDQDLQPAKPGDTIVFAIAEKSLKELVIRFNTRSPFGKKEVAYGMPLTVSVDFDAADAKRNRYKFKCVDTAVEEPAPGAGGEMEVLPPP